MRHSLILLAAGTAALATPALAQLNTGGVVNGGASGQVGVNPGQTIGDVTGQVTRPVGDTVDRVDRSVDDQVDSTTLKLATREQVRAGANVSDTDGNSIGTVQSVDGDTAVVVSGGKLYNVPLSSLYRKGEGAANGLISKLPKDRLTAHAAAGADADAGADAR